MTDMNTKERLVLACVIIFCAFGTTAWVGGRTLVKALDQIEANTEFRISQLERIKSVDRRLENIETKVDLLPKIVSKLEQWEAVEKD